MSGCSADAGALTRTTATSVDGSAPTTVAGYEAPPSNPTRIRLVPATTWSLVTTSPRLSITKPEPSELTCCFCAGAKNVGGTCCVCVAVITTTPGAASR